VDGDGVAEEDDCDDTNSSVYPDAGEVCDEIDNDCDGDVDEGLTETYYLDYDGDGYGDDDLTESGCDAPGSLYTTEGGDCDDTDDAIHPEAEEGCDGGDYNCDGDMDNDADEDGYADAECGGDDCDDDDPDVLPEVGGAARWGSTAWTFSTTATMTATASTPSIPTDTAPAKTRSMSTAT
jgi:hypothetical protein